MNRPLAPDLAERVAGLSPEKRELLEKRLKARRLESPSSDAIPRLDGRREAPLSFAQQRLWFLDQLERGSSSYNVPSAVRLKGPLDPTALQRSLEMIVRRHAALRTRFPSVDGKPVQLIEEDASMPLPVVDLTRFSDEEKESEVQRLVRAEARRPFDLAQGPVIRAGLLRLAADHHVFLCTLHHIVSDGWSRTILFRELAASYDALSNGRDPSLPPLPIQYADYAEWQHAWRESGEMQTALDYWRRELGGELPVLELPTDRPRPAVQTLRGAHHSFLLPPAIERALKALCREEGATLFMGVLAAYSVLLQRYTGQNDIIVGTLTANRNRVETEGLIGVFINAVAMRTDVSGDPTFRELLGRVREAALGAFAHQDVSFEKLVEALHPDRDLSRPPIYQTMLNLDTGPTRTLRLPGLSSENVPLTGETALLDLTLFIRDREDGLFSSLEYNPDLFEDRTIGRMAESFQTLLEGALARPDAKLSTISVMTRAESRRVLVEWNATDREYPRDRCFQQLFEEQAERTPDSVAVASGGETRTYRELNLQSNRLARLLKQEGIGPDAIVGLLCERGIDLLAAILAVFKSGGAYLPLDPGHPLDRIRDIVGRSGCRLVLSSAAFAPLLSAGADAAGGSPRTIVLDRRTGEAETGENLPPSAGPRNLAYVIFTSGSTGVPKGAMIEHRGMLNHLFAKVTDLEMTGSDSLAQTASQCFDISVWQFLAPLIVGGRVVVLGDDITHDPGRLFDTIEREAISIVEVVPSVLRAMLDARPAGALPDLRWMIATGEALPAPLAREWLHIHPAIPLLNAYGPTECSDDVTHHPVRFPPPLDALQIPIGRPIANTRLYVLDASLSPVPVGVAGELCVGGDGVGRGYLNDEKRTAEAFVPDPFASSAEARLYKTGDRSRFRSDGTIEFLGRIDHQVKVRGFRIELGEIESALSACAGVAQAVCVAREDGGADKRLVAYVVPESGRDLSVGEIRATLKRTLPEYMVPSAFVLLESLPLTPNGKLDRRRLPAPEQSGGELAAGSIAPRSAAEELLAEIWCRVLGIDRVGVFDDFFERGGHSLLATQVVSRVRDAFQTELPLRAVFELPTVAALAERIETSLRAGQAPAGRPVARASRTGEQPLSFAQQRLWFFDQVAPGSSAYNIRRAVRLRGSIDREALRRSLQAIVDRHEVLRTSFPARDGRPVAVVASEATLELPVLDLREKPREQREKDALRHLTEQAEKPFDLARGPLLRACLVRLGEEEHIFGLAIHHIVSDLWSLGVFFGELSKLYEAFVAGKASPLPELPIQYADYTLWQREELSGTFLDEQLSYWKRQLDRAPELASLPVDRPRPAVRTFQGARQPVAFSIALTEALKGLSRRESATLYMTLLAGFAVLLSSYGADKDVVIGSPVAGRNRVDLEPLIGFFLNTLVLRVDLSGDPEFRQLIGRVREMALGAYAHQDLPFERLVEELRLPRNLSHNPLFQVWFVLQTRPEESRLAGLTLEPAEIGTTTARHDLQLTLTETEDGLRGSVDYSTDLFDGATIEALVDDLGIVLERISARPEERVGALRDALADARKARERRDYEDLERSSRQILKSAKRKSILG